MRIRIVTEGASNDIKALDAPREHPSPDGSARRAPATPKGREKASLPKSYKSYRNSVAADFLAMTTDHPTTRETKNGARSSGSRPLRSGHTHVVKS